MDGWLLLALCAGCVATEAAEPLIQVDIRAGHFVERASGRPVELRGFNYIGLFHSHGTFDPAHYDGAAAGRVFAQLRGDGFNVVRVFINTHAEAPGAVAEKGRAGLAQNYLGNVADFLLRARQAGVVVILFMDWKNRYPFCPLAIVRSQVDFLDLHFYPANAGEFERDLQSIEFPAVQRAAREAGKPVVVGEFGAFKQSFPFVEDAAQWMAELGSRYAALGCAGWLYWTLDTHEQRKELWHARDGDDAIYRRLRALPKIN